MGANMSWFSSTSTNDRQSNTLPTPGTGSYSVGCADIMTTGDDKSDGVFARIFYPIETNSSVCVIDHRLINFMLLYFRRSNRCLFGYLDENVSTDSQHTRRYRRVDCISSSIGSLANIEYRRVGMHRRLHLSTCNNFQLSSSRMDCRHVDISIRRIVRRLQVMDMLLPQSNIGMIHPYVIRHI